MGKSVGKESLKNNEKLQSLNYFGDLIVETSEQLFSSLGYEITENRAFNKAYFSSEEVISYALLEEKVAMAEEKIGELQQVGKNIQQESLLNGAQKELLLDRVEKAILTFQYHQHALYLEAEKAGFKITDEERDFHHQEKLLIEEKLYGKGILERPERLAKVGEKLHELFSKKGELLSAEEKTFMNDQMLSFFPENTQETASQDAIEKVKEPDVYIDEATIFPLVEVVLQLQGLDKEAMVKIEISGDEQQKEPLQQGEIFVLPQSWDDQKIYTYFEELGLEEKFKIIKQHKGSNSVGISSVRKHLKLAAPKNGKYELKKDVLSIIFDHEIATHVKSGIENLNGLNVKDSSRGDLEEGIALLNQHIGNRKDMELIYEASVGDICQFFGEVFDDDELKQAIAIYYKLSGTKGSVDDRFRRVRMGVPLGEKGTRKKDLVYGESKEILRELESLGKTKEGREQLNTYIRAFYATKLGYDSLKKIDSILDGICKIEEIEPNFPVFAGSILYWKLFKGKIDKNTMLKSDIRSILDINQQLDYSQRRLLAQAMQLIEEDSEYKKSRNS